MKPGISFKNLLLKDDLNKEIIKVEKIYLSIDFLRTFTNRYLYLNAIEIEGISANSQSNSVGKKDSFILPLPIINRAGCNLYLAGLKTDVLRKSKNLKTNEERYNLAASFQETVNKILKRKTEVAMKQFRNEIADKSIKYFVVAGGVAANETIRKGLKEVSLKMNFKPIFPSKEFCGDNAAMIAWAGIQRCKKNLFDKKKETVKSRWPLDVKAPFLKGPGLKF